MAPIASFEQHGQHAPLLTDTYLVTEVAERLDALLQEQVLLLPTLWLGASDHHLDFPGTVSVPNTIFTQVIKAVTRSIAGAGFRRVFFLNGHGGNVIPGMQALTELANESEHYDEMWLALASYWTLAEPSMDPAQHHMETPRLSHACEYETSMMLAIKGEIVRMDRVTASPPLVDSPYFHSETGGRIQVAHRMKTWTPTGAMGKPENATREKGESLLAAIVGEVTTFVEEFATWE